MIVWWRTRIEMGSGEATGVSPPAIGVSVEGNRLAQITVVGDLAGRHSTLRRISSSFFGLWDKMRDRTNPKMYQYSRRAD